MVDAGTPLLDAKSPMVMKSPLDLKLTLSLIVKRMRIATVVCATFLVCGSLCTAEQQKAEPLIACNLKAMNAAERPRYKMLVGQLRAAVRGRSSLPNGYVYTLDGDTLGLKEIGEWISMERMCCPFLTFQFSVSSDQADYSLALTGPVGVKSLLDEEFPNQAK